MANLIIGLLIGMWIGGMVGFFAFAILSVGHSADEHMRALRGE